MTFRIVCHNIDNDIHVRDCYCFHFLNRQSFDYYYGNDDDAQPRLAIAEVQIALSPKDQHADHREVRRQEQQLLLNLQPTTDEAMDRRRVVGDVVKIVPVHHHLNDVDVCLYYYYCYFYDLENRWEVLLLFLATVVVEMKFHADVH
jgi:hypothetical protein